MEESIPSRFVRSGRDPPREVATMTSLKPVHAAQALRQAAVRATLAPSVHNTQPWRLVIDGPVLSIRADRSRQLRVLDPTGRQLVLSCGCALFNARVALAAAGLDARVERFPDPGDPDLVARVTVNGELGIASQLEALDPVIELRQTNRRRFADDPVPEEV